MNNKQKDHQLAMFAPTRDGGEVVHTTAPPSMEPVMIREPPKFDGTTYEPEVDEARLSTLLDKVRETMLDGRWRTLGEIRQAVGQGSEPGISARLRDLRKAKWGAYTVERQRRGAADAGLFEYRVLMTQKA